MKSRIENYFRYLTLGVAGFLAIAAIVVITAAFFGWLLMLAQGALASHTGWQTWGYPLSSLIAACAVGVRAFFTPNRYR